MNQYNLYTIIEKNTNISVQFGGVHRKYNIKKYKIGKKTYII
jgi:hypothetical protein